MFFDSANEQGTYLARLTALRGDLSRLQNELHTVWTGRERTPEVGHLVYAYMIENTGIYEVFAKVVAEIQNGERLGPVSTETLAWVRVTEAYFFGDLPSTSPLSVRSSVRPDPRSTRRNAYHRLLGMELNDGAAGGAAYPFVRAAAANSELVSVFESLLREVWVARVNRNTTSGANPTDHAKVSELVQHLQAMLLGRRDAQRLDHVEFHAVATMSWFHQAIRSGDYFLMTDLQATGLETEEQKLFKIAQLVGHPAHGLSRSYFKIARPLSALFKSIEAKTFDGGANTAELYMDQAVGPNTLAENMETIIHHWSIISGRDMKAGRVSTA